MECINLGLIGCGSWGSRYIKIAAADPNINIIHICDRNPERLTKAGELLPNARTFLDPLELMAHPDIDGILIITPTPSHHLLVVQAIKQGKHVFVEKPIADNYPDAEHMVTVAEQHGKILMVGQILRFMPAIEMAKNIVQSGKLGKLLHVVEHRYGTFRVDVWPDWWTKMPGFLLLHLGSHSVDAILWITGKKPQWVFAQGKARKVSPQHGAIDAFSLSMELEEDILVGINHESYGGRPDLAYNLVIVGEKATLTLDGFNRLLLDQQEHYLQEGDIYKQALTDELYEFIDSVASKREPKVSGANLLPTVAALDAGKASLITHKAEEIILKERQ